MASNPVFPFCGVDASEDYTAPGAWPFDHQCIIRFPPDLARRLEEDLNEAEKRENCSVPEALDLVIKPLEAGARRWEIHAYGEKLLGTLVQLPRHVESHILQEPTKSDADAVLYKSADITQLLIVHRGPEPPNSDVELNRETFEWSSGLTPYTTRIGARSFRECPFDPKELRETEQALEASIRGEPYKTLQYLEMTDQEIEELRKTQPDNIWSAPAEVKALEAEEKEGSAAVGKEGETRVQQFRRRKLGERRNLLSFKSLSRKRKLRIMGSSGPAQPAKKRNGCADFY